MKRIQKYIFTLLVAAFAATSCTDWVDPVIPFNDFETGVYLRTLEKASLTFNFFDMDNSKFSVVVEAVDEEGGALVSDVVIFVAHRRGNTVSAEAKVRTITASEFQPAPFPRRDFPAAPERDFPWIEINVPANDAMSFLGLTLNDIEGGDFFEFRFELNDTKGRTFSNNNLSGDVAGGAYYASPFFYRVSVVCPSNLAGTFDAHTVGNGPWGCTNEWTGTVVWVHEGNGVYVAQAIDGDHPGGLEDFSMGAYWVCYGPTSTLPTEPGDGDLRINDACGKLFYAGASRWGELYWFNDLTVNGNVLVLDWENDYGEGGVVTLTRTDGNNWPASLRK